MARKHKSRTRLQSSHLANEATKVTEQNSDQNSSGGFDAMVNDPGMENTRSEYGGIDSNVSGDESILKGGKTLAECKSIAEDPENAAASNAAQNEITGQNDAIAELNKKNEQQEWIIRKLTENLQAKNDVLNQMNNANMELKQALDQSKNELESEQKARQDSDKQRHKAEGELKEFIELNTRKADAEDALKKKDEELMSLSARIEDQQTLVSNLHRQSDALMRRIKELEHQLATKKQSIDDILANKSFTNNFEIVKSDMSQEMQEDAIEVVADAINEYASKSEVTMYISKKMEEKFNAKWSCLISHEFGSYVGHIKGHYILLKVDMMFIVLFA